MKQNQMKHTPTPWEIGHQLGDGFSIVHEIAPNFGKLVCLATCHNIGGQAFHGFPLDDATAKANRDFIIRAANSHAELLRVLELLTNSAVWAKQMIGDIPEGSHFSQTIEEARKAIAEAS